MSVKTVPPIKIVYPKNGQKVYESSTFLVGSVPKGMKPRVNARLVPASTDGFFSYKIPLKEGANKILVEAVASAKAPAQVSRSLNITRVPPLPVLPAQPLKLHEQTLQPGQKTILKPGDYLTVACSASLNSKIEVSIPGVLDKPVPLMPVDTTQTGPFIDNRTTVFLEKHQTRLRIPAKGYYQAVVQIPAKAGPIENAPIQLKLSNGKSTLQKTLSAPLSIWTEPRLARVVKDLAVTRVAPGEEAARITPQRKGTRVWVDGLQEGWARVRLDKGEVFYIAEGDLAYQTPAAKPGGNVLEAIKTEPGRDAYQAKILLNTREQAPMTFHVSSSGQEQLLTIRLYDTWSQCDFVHSPVESDFLKRVTWKQLTDNIVEVTAAVDRLIGYDYAYTPQGWAVTLKTMPKTIAETKVLIDPGHGGAETGATGPNGLAEKTLNLSVSKLLADALKKEGFQVSMTRSTDVPVSLPGRSDQAARVDADIVLSIHHNALPDGRDPLKYEGACCFFYHPFSEPIAHALQEGLIAQGSKNNGVYYNNLHMARIHQGLAVLVELGYFTHPEDFQRVIQPKYQQSEAQALAKAVKNYVLTQQR